MTGGRARRPRSRGWPRTATRAGPWRRRRPTHSRPSGARPSSCPSPANPARRRSAPPAACGSRAIRTPPRRSPARTRSSPKAASAATASSSARTSTRAARSSTTRGCSTPAASSPRRTSSSPASSAPASRRSPRASTRARSRSAAASTSPATRRASTPPSPKPSAARPSRSGTACPTGSTRSTRATAPPGSTTPSGPRQVASRRRDLVGALAETVLDRRLTPLEHTAIDVALADTVRSSDVPILPMVVDRLLAPDPSDDSDGRLAEDGRLVGHALRRLVAGDLAGLFDGPSTVALRPDPADDLARPVPRHRERDAHLGADDLLLGVDGVRAPRPERRPALGRLRRGLAAHVPPRPAAADGRPLAARAALRHREHADLPQALRPRQRRRPGLRDARARLVAARQRRDPDRLPAGIRPARRDRGRARADRHRADAAARRSAPGRGCGGSRTARSSSSTSCTPPSWSSSTPPVA